MSLHSGFPPIHVFGSRMAPTCPPKEKQMNCFLGTKKIEPVVHTIIHANLSHVDNIDDHPLWTDYQISGSKLRSLQHGRYCSNLCLFISDFKNKLLDTIKYNNYSFATVMTCFPVFSPFMSLHRAAGAFSKPSAKSSM
jgi:hypothetical protein